MNDALSFSERVSISLRALYAKRGYAPFKVNQFEEYELYMRNKSFLTSENILAFTDTDGKLLAMKPDVTLSIVKNTTDADVPCRVMYAEPVYRVPRGAEGFREIMQTGIEYIGPVDEYVMGETLMLAARSLEAISQEYALDISDLGVVTGILAETTLTKAEKRQIMQRIAEKNTHGLRGLCEELEVPEMLTGLLVRLIGICGPLSVALDALMALRLPEGCAEAVECLRTMGRLAEIFEIRNVNLDFSVMSDLGYYNGLTFAGFVEGVPTSVLSGGRYDPLLTRMGRKAQGIGFAVYLDQIGRIQQEKRGNDVDVLLIYEPGEAPEDVARMAQTLAKDGRSVRVQAGEAGTARAGEIIRMGKAEKA